jgi:hypothetical protein
MYLKHDKTFSGNKLCQLWIKSQRFGDHLYLHHQPPPPSPDDGGRDGLRNVGLLSTIDTACCPRRFYQVQSP